VPTYRDSGVVLRTHKLGEADRIVTLLSHRHGKLRAVARGVRRTSSKFGARLEPFTHVDLQFATGRTLDVITEAVTIRPYSEPLTHDYAAYTAGQVMLETADRLVSEEGQPSIRQYNLLVGGLHALTHGTSDGRRPATMVMDSYLIRAMATAGFAPALAECAVCGTPGPHESFHAASGGLVCRGCRPPASGLLSAGTLDYLQALLTGDWPATREIPDAVARQASGLLAAFVSWHLERGLRTLDYVDR
jgi:DNA repair protein RecO (recombination protein O)